MRRRLTTLNHGIWLTSWPRETADGNVRIWSTEAIYKSFGQDDVPIPKQLCALSHHTGAVLTVRFSGNNRYLASGSDDKIVLVYERDQAAGARPAFGAGESHTEVWRTHRRLAAHENDVQDCAWSADSSVLVSVGLDSKVMVWSGSTFERLKKIDLHHSHVKGVSFDPANKYFATSSDDRTVKIHRFTSPASNASAHDQAGNFTLEFSISGPFEESPLTTYFRRCSWSPDGSHVAAPNAVNGPVSSVAIINRGNWDSEINLIGHEGPVEVCAFAPRMFSQDPANMAGGSAVTVIACAGQDKALSVWNTSNPRPLVIIQDISTKTISDLSWSPDGKAIFVSALDGRILCMAFDDGDLGFVLAVEENERILQKFGTGRKGATLPEGPDSMRLEEMSRAEERREVEGRMGALMGGHPAPSPINNAGDTNSIAMVVDSGPSVGPQWQAMHQQPSSSINNINNSSNSNSNATAQAQIQADASAQAEKEKEKEKERERPYKQKVTITKDGKKRVAPLLVSTGDGHRSNLPNAQLLLHAAAAGGGAGSMANVDPKSILDLSRPYDGLPKGGLAALIIGNKRKAVEESSEDDPVAAAAAAAAGPLGGKRIAVTQAPDSKGAQETPEFIRPAIIAPATSMSQVRLAVPKVRTFVSRAIDPATGHPSASVPPATGSAAAAAAAAATAAAAAGSGSGLGPGSSSGSGPASTDIVFEAKNSREPTRLTISRGGQALWVDFLPRPVLLVTGNANFWCAACEDGGIHVFTPVGRRLLNALVVEAQPCFLDCRDWWLMCISAVGLAHVWNLRTLTAAHPPVSLAPILDVANTYAKPDAPTRAEAVQEAAINSGGTLVVSLTNGDGYAYSRDLCIWQRLSEAWWAVGSQYWDASGSLRPSAAVTESLGGAGEPARSQGVVAHLERRTTSEVLLHGRGRLLQRIVKQVLSREGFEGFETSVSIAHLENRLAAAVALGAKDDFKSYLLTYARRIASEGMRGKVEELLRDLMGDVAASPAAPRRGRPLDDGDAEICGWSARELMRGVLIAIGVFSALCLSPCFCYCFRSLPGGGRGPAIGSHCASCIVLTSGGNKQASTEIYSGSRCHMRGF